MYESDEDDGRHSPPPILVDHSAINAAWMDTFGRKPMQVRKVLMCPAEITPAKMKELLLGSITLPGYYSFDGEFYDHPNSKPWTDWDEEQKIFDIAGNGEIGESGPFLRFGQFANGDGVCMIVDFFHPDMQPLPEEIAFLLRGDNGKRIGFAWRSDAKAINLTYSQHFKVDDRNDVVADGQVIFERMYQRKIAIRKWCKKHSAPDSCACGVCVLPTAYKKTSPNLDDLIEMLFEKRKSKGWKPHNQDWNLRTPDLEALWRKQRRIPQRIYDDMADDAIGHYDLLLALMRDYGSLVKLKNCLSSLRGHTFRLTATNLWDLLPVRIAETTAPVSTLAAEPPRENSNFSSKLNIDSSGKSSKESVSTHSEPSASTASKNNENSSSRFDMPVVGRKVLLSTPDSRDISLEPSASSSTTFKLQRRPLLTPIVRDKQIFVTVPPVPIIVTLPENVNGFMPTIPCHVRRLIKETVRNGEKLVGRPIIRPGRSAIMRRPDAYRRVLEQARQKVEQLGQQRGTRPFSRAEKNHIFEMIESRLRHNVTVPKDSNRPSEKRRIESKRQNQIAQGRRPTYGTVRSKNKIENKSEQPIIKNRQSSRNSLQIRRENFKRRPYNALLNAVQQQQRNRDDSTSTTASSSRYTSQLSLAGRENRWQGQYFGKL